MLSDVSVDEYPVITQFNVRQRPYYIILWMCYVGGVNLHEHCLKTFTTNPNSYKSRKFGTKICRNVPIVLDERRTPYYYICGVTDGFIWGKNLHIAFRYKRGAELVKDTERDLVTIRNAEEIPILQEYIDRNNPHASSPIYNTCRNWRFGHYVAKQLELGLPDIVGNMSEYITPEATFQKPVSGLF